jgi:hypothetical protein
MNANLMTEASTPSGIAPTKNEWHCPVSRCGEFAAWDSGN